MREYFSVESNVERVKKVLLSWLGTPYMHLAMVKGRGADCTKFIAAAMMEAGIITEVEDNGYYPKDWYINGRREILLFSIVRHIKYLKDGLEIRAIQNESLIFGDLLCFSTHANRISNHAGIALGGDFFIHAVKKAGVTKAQFEMWRNKLTNVFRLYYEV